MLKEYKCFSIVIMSKMTGFREEMNQIKWRGSYVNKYFKETKDTVT